MVEGGEKKITTEILQNSVVRTVSMTKNRRESRMTPSFWSGYFVDGISKKFRARTALLMRHLLQNPTISSVLNRNLIHPSTLSITGFSKLPSVQVSFPGR